MHLSFKTVEYIGNRFCFLINFHVSNSQQVRVTPIRTEIIIRATRTKDVLGDKGCRIRELTAMVQKRFKFPENSVELFAERVENRASCAMAQCESLRYKLLGLLPVRRACYGIVRFIMENGAKGCEVLTILNFCSIELI